MAEIGICPPVETVWSSVLFGAAAGAVFGGIVFVAEG